MKRDRVVQRLLRSREPSIRWKTRTLVLGEDPGSRRLQKLQDEILRAPRTRALLREPVRPGSHPRTWGVYRKWLGAHWALATLADLGYPAGDETLRPTLDRALETWLRPAYFAEFEAKTRREAEANPRAVPRLQGRFRRCASQQGNALFYAATFGMHPDACDLLAERLLHWQWPDGGWNCDRDPDADTSAFAETLTPMLGLATYGRLRRRSEALRAARRASEVFLTHRLYRRISNGRVMNWEFPRLQYPHYYHYDILGGLRALRLLERGDDPRCADALDLISSRELASGGWAADHRLYDLPGERPRRGTDRVLWGGSAPRFNEWVTVEALAALVAGGRFTPAR